MKKNFTKTLLSFLCLFFTFCFCGTNAFAQPVNNDCAGALPTTMNPGGSCASTTAVVTTGATTSTPTIISGTFCTSASANDDVWYTFTTSATQTGVLISFNNLVATSGSASSVGVAVYSGLCTGLTQIFCSTSIAPTGAAYAPLNGLSPNTTYYIRTWAAGSGNSATYNMCVQEGLVPNCATNLSPATGSTPALLCSPNPSSVVFSWSPPSTGPAPTAYNFYFDTGTPVFIGTTALTAVTIYNLSPNTTYNWYIVPTNNGINAIGCNTPLSFTTGPEPACVANNSCGSATAIGTPGNVGTLNSTTTGSTISMAAEACAGFTGTADDDVWFSFTTDGDGGNVTIALTGAASTLDAVIQAYSGTCGSLSNIGCADAGTSGGQNETLNLTGLAANTTYYIRVYGYGTFSSTSPTSGAFTLTTSGTGLAGVIATTLTTLTATLQKENALINWHIAQESDNKGFEILKGYDGTNFTTIGFVNSKGNTSVGADYSYLDKNIRGGVKTFYRLRQVDNDGQSKLTDIVSVKLNKNASSMAFVYPNPAKGLLNLTFNEPLRSETTINITDATGRILLKTKAPRAAISIQLNVARFNNGSYFIRMMNEQKTEQLSFIKAE